MHLRYHAFKSKIEAAVPERMLGKFGVARLVFDH